MKKITLFTFGFVFFLSCSNSDIHKITIENNSNHAIDSALIKVEGQTIRFGNIQIGKSETKAFSVITKSRSEGGFYGPIFMHESDTLRAQFGYYSNTDDIKSSITIVVDSTGSIKQKL